MRMSWRREWPMWLLLGTQFLLAAVTWPWAPERIPTHLAVDGQADGYGGRFEGLLLLPLVSLGLYLAMLYVPQVDPRHESYGAFSGSYTVLRFAVLAMMTAMYGMMQLALRGHPVEVNRVMPLSLGTLFVVIGIQMGRLRQSWFGGLRTPWDLSSQG